MILMSETCVYQTRPRLNDPPRLYERFVQEE